MRAWGVRGRWALGLSAVSRTVSGWFSTDGPPVHSRAFFGLLVFWGSPGVGVLLGGSRVMGGPPPAPAALRAPWSAQGFQARSLPCGAWVSQPPAARCVCAGCQRGRRHEVRPSGECDPRPVHTPGRQALPGLHPGCLAGGAHGWRPQWTLCGPETVTQAAIMCLFLRIAKVREDFSTEGIMQVSTEMFFKSFFVLS